MIHLSISYTSDLLGFNSYIREIFFDQSAYSHKGNVTLAAEADILHAVMVLNWELKCLNQQRALWRCSSIISFVPPEAWATLQTQQMPCLVLSDNYAILASVDTRGWLLDSLTCLTYSISPAVFVSSFSSPNPPSGKRIIQGELLLAH